MKFYKLGKKSLIMSVMLGSIVLTGCTTQANKEENLDNKNQIVVKHELGTTTLDSIDSSYDEYIENFETIAEIVGKEDVAKAKIEEAEKVLSDVKDKAKDKVSDEEVLTVSPKNDEYTAHTSSSFVGQVLEKAGFKNAIQSDDREASLSLEQLVEINPDIIVYMRDDIDTTIYTQWKNTQLYKSLDAVKNNKVYTTVARGPWTQYRGFISVNTLTKEMSGWLLNN